MRTTAPKAVSIGWGLLLVGFGPGVCAGEQKFAVEVSAVKVGKYEKIELLIHLEKKYRNPFDPHQVDLAVQLKTPTGKSLILPAFYCQDYQRRRFDGGRNRANWFYPIGEGTWKARFAPMEVGTYRAAARLKDRSGTRQTDSVRFDCTRSQRKGFVRASQKDPRFLEFTEGAFFFPIGQNLAFIGEGQYVNLSKAEEIFAKLSKNGANFLRIWTCCKDWAMAIEARKSAWGRSWDWRAPIVAVPSSEHDPNARKCIKIAGGDGTPITVSPSHPVGLRPDTRYIVSGKFKADGKVGLRVEVNGSRAEKAFPAGPKDGWTELKREFTTGPNQFWLGRMVLQLDGAGTAWLDELSLKEAGGGAELLWEADVNRPRRGVYNQVDCFILDQLVEAAEKNGIYLMLCVVTRDLYMKSLDDHSSSEYRQAIEDARKLMRYAVARWGYSTSVAAWEYFNEINPGQPTDRFYAEVGRYLEQIDVYRHLRTTSTWHPSAKDCRHPQLDVGQLHHYMRPTEKERFKDEVAVVIDKTRFLREHAPKKPVLIGEFGLATDRWGLSQHMKQDAKLSHFHNSLWASAFSGNSGTALFWWWDQLDRMDAYHHYRPLASFLRDVSFVKLRQISASVSEGQVRVLGYQGKDRAYAWLFNPQATWWNLVAQKATPGEIKGATLEIRGLAPGNYRVQWWDTHQGKTLKEEKGSGSPAVLRLSVPPFSRDIAAKIVPQGR